MMTNQEHGGLGDNVFINGDAIYKNIQKHPTILAEIINELGRREIISVENGTIGFNEYKISDKIDYNKLIIYKEVINEHKIYQGKLNNLYDELEKQGSYKKHVLLKNIRYLYLKAKGKYLSESDSSDEYEIICENSDNIIQEIENELSSDIDRSENIQESLEVIRTGILVILVDAFIRCEILEEPK